MHLIDTHCHLDFDVFDEDRTDIIEKSRERQVLKLIIPGVLKKGWEGISDLVDTYEGFFGAYGFHPCYLDSTSIDDCESLSRLIRQKDRKTAALGEIGLDFFIENPDREFQREIFLCQVDLAMEHRLPLILHVRKAHDQVAKILKDKRFPFGGTVHCYSGSLQQARHYLDIGFKIGIGGVVTYKRAKRLRRIVTELPLSSFVLETDAPDIPVYGHQNQRNSPEYLPCVFNAFCELRQESDDKIMESIYHNTVEIFPALKEAE